MVKSEEKILFPPYASYIGTVRLLDSIRDHLPDQIDRGVMSSLSGSAQSSMLKTLESLGLIDASGKPTKMLHELLSHPRTSQEFKDTLANVVRSAYPYLFDGQINLKSATTNQVQAVFRAQNVSGSTVSKCMAFFLAAAKEAGIEISKYVRVPPMADLTTKKRNSSARNAAAVEDNEDEFRPGDVLELKSLQGDLHPALAGLLRGLPAPGQGMSAKERERFLKAFEAVLAVAHPTTEE